MHQELENWAVRELRRLGVANPEAKARNFMKWLQASHRQSNSGGAHQHLTPGSPRALSRLQQFLSEEN
jgi:hypothetical protein